VLEVFFGEVAQCDKYSQKKAALPVEVCSSPGRDIKNEKKLARIKLKLATLVTHRKLRQRKA